MGGYGGIWEDMGGYGGIWSQWSALGPSGPYGDISPITYIPIYIYSLIHKLTYYLLVN